MQSNVTVLTMKMAIHVMPQHNTRINKFPFRYTINVVSSKNHVKKAAEPNRTVNSSGSFSLSLSTVMENIFNFSTKFPLANSLPTHTHTYIHSFCC